MFGNCLNNLHQLLGADADIFHKRRRFFLLLGADADILHKRRRFFLKIDLPHQSARLGIHGTAAVENFQLSLDFIAHKDISCNRKLGDQIQFLIDHADPEIRRNRR